MSKDGDRDETGTVSIPTPRVRIARHRERTAITRPRLGSRGEAWANQVFRRHPAPGAGLSLARRIASRHGPLARRAWQVPPLVLRAALAAWAERQESITSPRRQHAASSGGDHADIARPAPAPPVPAEAAPSPALAISRTSPRVQRYRRADREGPGSPAGPALRGGVVSRGQGAAGPVRALPDGITAPARERVPWFREARPSPLTFRSGGAADSGRLSPRATPVGSPVESAAGGDTAGARDVGVQPRALPPPMPVTVRRQELVTGSGPGAAPSLPGPSIPMAAPLWPIVARHSLPVLVHRMDRPLFAGTMAGPSLGTPEPGSQAAVGARSLAPFGGPVTAIPAQMAGAQALTPEGLFQELAPARGAMPKGRPGPAPSIAAPGSESPAALTIGGAMSLVWQAPASQPGQAHGEETSPSSSAVPVQDAVTVSLQTERGMPRSEAEGQRAPSLSVPAVAEQVYRLLERRLVIERERRGIF